MPGAADLAQRIADIGREFDALPVKRDNTGADLDPHAGERWPEMVEFNPGADRILSLVEMGQHQVAAGLLDSCEHERRGEDAQILAHEVDRLVDRDIEAAGGLQIGRERRFHAVSLFFVSRTGMVG